MAKRDNSNMNKSKNDKNNEFYTLLDTIEKEMKYYKNQFKDKIIYCNCDDARESNFFKYFSMNFEHLGLKKLISTSYNEYGKGTILIYEGDKNGNNIVEELNGNGDFRSKECLQILQDADIIVTNPPFSLFREYMKVLMDFNKKFIILGNINAITYKDIFVHLKNGRLWYGRSLNGSKCTFRVPMDFQNKWTYVENGINYCPINNTIWFTNIENNKYVDTISLIKEYNDIDYPIYDNYNAINVNKIKDIPYDYDGVIGVPITILNYLCSDGLLHFDTPITKKKLMQEYSPTLYKLIGNEYDLNIEKGRGYINGKRMYGRLFIQRIN